MVVKTAGFEVPMLSDSPSSAQAIPAALQELLAICVRRGASDLHLAPGLPPHLRISGVLEPMTSRGPLSAEAVEQLAQPLLARGDRERFQITGDADGALSCSLGARFRFNVFRRQGELAIALRKLEDKCRDLAALGLPDSLYGLCSQRDGLVLVAGPTGAGKSTTLATLIDRINQTRPCHIVTIEDPIEYIHVPARALVNQRQIGLDAGSFQDALVASLRQDPDVILVGEIREQDTIRTAISASETGHLVFSTVHAGDCVGAIERLVSVFSADEQDGIRRQLALVLRAVIAQHLVIADGRKTEAESVRRRVVASEVMMVTTAVANLIAVAKTSMLYSAMETGAMHGMQTLEQDLARLWAAGEISEMAAVALARDPAVLRERHKLAQRTSGRISRRLPRGQL